jgi:hypothetical protein
VAAAAAAIEVVEEKEGDRLCDLGGGVGDNSWTDVVDEDTDEADEEFNASKDLRLSW